MLEAGDEKPRVLIIDDEALIRDLLSDILAADYACATVSSAEEAALLLKKETFNLVLSDIKMGKMSGLELIPLVRESAQDTVVVMISSEQHIDAAINSMRVGAFDYIKKPFNVLEVQMVIHRALEHHLLLATKRRYENYLKELVTQRTEKLNYLAQYDALTNLPNRVLFEDRLSQALALTQHNRQMMAVAFLSLDRFKKVHDLLGPACEGRLLQETARRLENCTKDIGGTTIARFERDEFAVLFTQITNAQTVVEIINNINKAINESFVIDDHEIFLTASIGITLSPNDGADAQTLLKNAGAALYRAKKQGRNNYQFFTAEIKADALKRMTLENNLRRALERGEFEVFYQPKININTGQIAGMEALVRWRAPEAGIISPMEFIPLAEETGMILPIGEWVLRTACAQTKVWADEGFAPLQLSVNLSPRQFKQSNLLEVITGIIQDTGIDANYLELEVTESSVMQNTGEAVKTLRKLKNLGVKISIDDFGTGYSSLGYLKRLPLDVLKIDKSFVQDVTFAAEDAAIVMTIISLAHNLNLKVIAEGVEAEEQLKFLQLLKCDEWQGFLYSKPVTAADFRELLLKNGGLKSKATP